jgi:hypothetical protein
MDSASHASMVIIRDAAFGVSGVKSHHRAFPEIYAYGESPADAAIHLRRRMALAYEEYLDSWAREDLMRAIAEV